jgi:hypothetical protein
MRIAGNPGAQQATAPGCAQLGYQQSVFECGPKRPVSARLNGEYDITLSAAIDHHPNEGAAIDAAGEDRRAAGQPIASMQSLFDRCRHRRRQT